MIDTLKNVVSSLIQKGSEAESPRMRPKLRKRMERMRLRGVSPTTLMLQRPVPRHLHGRRLRPPPARGHRAPQQVLVLLPLQGKHSYSGQRRLTRLLPMPPLPPKLRVQLR